MPRRAAHACFDRVRVAGLCLPGVEAATKYDGSPVLKLRGCFLAGLAMHPSAESGSLVVRVDLEQRVLLLDDAPDTYYVTDHYEPIPSCWSASRASIALRSATCCRYPGS